MQFWYSFIHISLVKSWENQEKNKFFEGGWVIRFQSLRRILSTSVSQSKLGPIFEMEISYFGILMTFEAVQQLYQSAKISDWLKNTQLWNFLEILNNQIAQKCSKFGSTFISALLSSAREITPPQEKMIFVKEIVSLRASNFGRFSAFDHWLYQILVFHVQNFQNIRRSV